MDLEQIFDSMENKVRDVRDEFRFSIREGIAINSKDKVQLPDEIPEKMMGYFRRRKIALDGDHKYEGFGNAIKARINPESITEIFYGMFVVSNKAFVPREVPIRIIKPFSESNGWGKWALSYLFDGIYVNHTSKKVQYSENTLYGNIREVIMNGMEHLKIMNRKYDKSLFLPFEKDIKLYLHPAINKVKISPNDPSSDSGPQNIDYNEKPSDPFSDFSQAKKFSPGGSGTGGSPGVLF